MPNVDLTTEEIDALVGLIEDADMQDEEEMAVVFDKLVAAR